jgi:hypothetical protein
MAGQRERVDEAGELAEVSLLMGRAGIALSGAELAALVEPYRRNRAALQAMRAELELGDEPATTFEA